MLPIAASIFSGRFTHNHKVKQFTPYKLHQRSTLQAYLQRDGYRTPSTVSTSTRSASPAIRLSSATGRSSRRAQDTYAGGSWNINGDKREVSGYSTDFLRRKALAFLDGGDAPWLMFISTPAPPFLAEPPSEARLNALHERLTELRRCIGKACP